MERWYALYSNWQGAECDELLEQAVSHALWECCQIPKKVKVFRLGAILHLLEDVMFPDYLFVKTGDPDGLTKELEKAQQFPKFVGSTKNMIVPVEKKIWYFSRMSAEKIYSPPWA